MKIGDFVMIELKALDQIAYVRFASVYREFSDISEFVATLESLDPSSEIPIQSREQLKKLASKPH
jgi:transcriptional repressor NrdR